uniref:Uncharacterized protein n=1 Tax=Sipha flava TaxID=143950 RepID=A0A2S2Q588_9HEMI
MMDDFPRGVPCRVVFFSSPRAPFSFLVPFCHIRRRLTEIAGGPRQGFVFPRERLNVKQETVAATEAGQSFVGGGGELQIYIYKRGERWSAAAAAAHALYIYTHRVREREKKRKNRVCVWAKEEREERSMGGLVGGGAAAISGSVNAFFNQPTFGGDQSPKTPPPPPHSDRSRRPRRDERQHPILYKHGRAHEPCADGFIFLTSGFFFFFFCAYLRYPPRVVLYTRAHASTFIYIYIYICTQEGFLFFFSRFPRFSFFPSRAQTHKRAFIYIQLHSRRPRTDGIIKMTDYPCVFHVHSHRHTHTHTHTHASYGRSYAENSDAKPEYGISYE